MAWPTTSQNHFRWDDAANPASLPNVSGSPTQSTSLKVGHTCYSVSDSMLYYCTTATYGGAVWAPCGGGGNDSFPDIDQVLFVDKTSGSYTPDGTIQFPYNSINAAFTAANALSPGPTNRFGIIVMPGIYDEIVYLRDYCYLIGMNRESCIIQNSGGTPLRGTDVTSGAWNVTVHETGTYWMLWCDGSNFEFHNCHIYGNGASGNVLRIDNTATNESVFKAYGCLIENPDPDYGSINLYNDSVAEFYECELHGYPYIEGATSAARFKLKDCLVVGNISSWGYHHIEVIDTEVDCSTCVVYDWPFNFRGIEASAKLQNCRTKTNGISSVRDVWANAAMDVECINCRFEMGADSTVWINTPNNDVHVGGLVDQYHLFDEMLVAGGGWTGRGDVTVHLHQDDVTTGIDVGVAHDKIIVDGHGHHLAHATPTTTIPISTGRGTGEEWLFKNMTFDDSISAAVPGTGISTVHQYRDVEINGALKLSVGTETGDLEVEFEHVKGRGNATDVNAVQFSCNPAGTPPKLLVTGVSHLQGQSGNPAFYWHTLAGFGDLRMAFSTILHGSLGANNPMGDDGTPTPPITYRATHCQFNSNPDVGNFLNSVAPGQRFCSFDPLVAF